MLYNLPKEMLQYKQVYFDAYIFDSSCPQIRLESLIKLWHDGKKFFTTKDFYLIKIYNGRAFIIKKKKIIKKEKSLYNDKINTK